MYDCWKRSAIAGRDDASRGRQFRLRPKPVIRPRTIFYASRCLTPVSVPALTWIGQADDIPVSLLGPHRLSAKLMRFPESRKCLTIFTTVGLKSCRSGLPRPSGSQRMSNRSGSIPSAATQGGSVGFVARNRLMVAPGIATMPRGTPTNLGLVRYRMQASRSLNKIRFLGCAVPKASEPGWLGLIAIIDVSVLSEDVGLQRASLFSEEARCRQSFSSNNGDRVQITPAVTGRRI